MADTTVSLSGTSIKAKTQFSNLQTLNPTGHHIVSLSFKMVAGNPATDYTLYTVPDGRTFVVTKVMTGKSDAAAQDIVFYDSAGNVASDSRAYFFCPDWSKYISTYTYSPGLVFSKGITIDSTNQTATHNYFFDIQGYLV